MPAVVGRAGRRMWGIAACVVGAAAFIAAEPLIGGAGAQGPVTIHVDGGGHGASCSDARGAGAARKPGTPVCSIERGIAIAPAGARVDVRGGSYEALSIGGGSRSALVTVAAHAGESVSLPRITIEGAARLRFERLNLTGGSGGSTFEVEEGDSHQIQLVGSRVRSTSSDAIELRWGVSDVLIEGNHITSRAPGGGGGNGVTLTSTARRPGVPDPDTNVHPPVRDVVIRNNFFDGIGTDAIRPANFQNLLVEGNEITGLQEEGSHSDTLQTVWGGDHLTFRGNYVHDNEGQGFFIKDGRVTDVNVENNVFVGNRGNGYQFNVYDTIGLRVVNNTFWDNQANVVIRDGIRRVDLRNNLIEKLDGSTDEPGAIRASMVQDYNLIGSGNGWSLRGPHDRRGAPRFVAPGAGDYRLAPTSAGIDAATSDAAPARDKACRPRFDVPGRANRGGGSAPFVDMGALEYGPQSATGDTAAPWRGDCASPPPRSKSRARVRLLRARAGKRLVLTLRVSRACRVRASASARWRAGGKLRVRRVGPTGRRLGGRTVKIRLKTTLPRKVRARLARGRRVLLRVRVTATDCRGSKRTLRRTVRLRRR